MLPGKGFRRVRTVVALLLLAMVATACFSGGDKGRFNDSQSAVIKSKPAYILMGSDDSVKLTTTVLTPSGKLTNEPLRADVRFVGDLNTAASGWAVAATSTAADAEIGPDGLFRANRQGVYEIQFSNVDRSIDLTVPVTVLPHTLSPLASVIMDFTTAVENGDADTVRDLITDDFRFFSELYGNPDVNEPLTYIDLPDLSSFIQSWKIRDISIANEAPGVTVVEGLSELETVQRMNDERPFYSFTASAVSLRVIEVGGRPKIDEMRLERIPFDDSNWPNVKALVTVPAKTVIPVDSLFEYGLGYRNEGGSGYFAIYTSEQRPDGSGESWLEPAWINANARESMVSGSGSGVFSPGTVTLEVVVFSGPTPNEFIETDRQVFTFEVR